MDERPPRENLVRGVMPFEVRQDAESEEGLLGRTLSGHFARFNEWTEINSMWEGHFMERIAPGAFKKTFDDNRSRMKVLFNHGLDPSVGQQVLGPIGDLREDSEGARYEVPLLDTPYNRSLLPGLQRGLYGSSFRFSVGREDFNKRASAGDHNPNGLPERTVLEANVKEFGAVTFPAYQGATALARSLTDDFLVMALMGDPDRLRQVLMGRGGDAPGDGSKPYGDVEYADPGYQADKQKRYPIDTAEHVHAALSYIAKAENAAKYSPGDLAKVKAKIHAAAKKFGITVADEQKSQELPKLVLVRNPARVAS